MTRSCFIQGHAWASLTVFILKYDLLIHQSYQNWSFTFFPMQKFAFRILFLDIEICWSCYFCAHKFLWRCYFQLRVWLWWTHFLLQWLWNPRWLPGKLIGFHVSPTRWCVKVKWLKFFLVISDTMYLQDPTLTFMLTRKCCLPFWSQTFRLPCQADDLTSDEGVHLWYVPVLSAAVN